MFPEYTALSDSLAVGLDLPPSDFNDNPHVEVNNKKNIGIGQSYPTSGEEEN